ncbi:TolC family protein, partial [Escherichia coli]|uniref:TolC family protein n=1 Tax=Escherichia coli TaxID=562 RepID=UPI001BFC9D41
DQTARDGRGERVNLIGLSMPLPLFDRNQGNIYAAQSRADQARDLQRATLLRLRSEAVQAYDQLRTSEQELALVRRDLLPGAQSSGVGAALLRRFAEDHRGAYLFTDATLGTEAFFRRHGIH